MIEVSVSGTDNILQFTSKSREQFAIVLDLFSGTEYCWLCGMRSLEHFLEGSAPLRLWYVKSEEIIGICYSSHLS